MHPTKNMRFYLMEDVEIYNLAMDVISSITNDLNENLYSTVNGTLSVHWLKDDKFNASAQSRSSVDEPPFHIVNMYFELARQLYRDIEEYCNYIESECDKHIFDELFRGICEYKEILPSNFLKADYRKNMFISALTWVFFHELGHLEQEHGFIRSQLDKSSEYLINECEMYSMEKPQGKDAAISHVTEMAADYASLSTCIVELIGHFEGEDLEKAIGVFVCAVSCAIYKFHGKKSLCLDTIPKGTHPLPIVRLANILPQIWETFDLAESRNVTKISMNRSDLVRMCNRNATTVGLFWFRKNSLSPDSFDDFFLERTIDKSRGKEYMQVIVNTWDEIEPTLTGNRRFNNSLSLMGFSEHYRKLIFGKNDDK